MKSKVFLWVLCLILLGGNIIFGLQYFTISKELEGTKVIISSQRYNGPVLNFMKMFIKRVLKAKQGVDFETRLKLENAVRDLGDEQILKEWQQFVNSGSESEAQQNVKNLLELLVDKVYIR